MGRAKSIGGLGFSDLSLFNKALLVKQCWRMIQFPDSLSSRILKAKYFPKSSLFDAELGKRPFSCGAVFWLPRTFSLVVFYGE